MTTPKHITDDHRAFAQDIFTTLIALTGDYSDASVRRTTNTALHVAAIFHDEVERLNKENG